MDRDAEDEVHYFPAAGCNTSPLLELCKEALDPPALAVGDTSIAAIYKARGLTRSDMARDLAVGQVRASRQPAPNGWRITWRASYEASEHSKKQNANVTMRVALPLLSEAVHSDKRCLQAAAAGARLEVGIWMQRIGHHGLIDVDSFAIATMGDSKCMIRFANPALRDALRVLILRSAMTRRFSGTPSSRIPCRPMRPNWAAIAAPIC